MLHERILVLIKYVTDVIAGRTIRDSEVFHGLMSHIYSIGQARPDHAALRSLSALLASLPASENKHFRDEFDTVSSSYNTSEFLHDDILDLQEYEDVQLTAFLATLTKSTNILNDVRVPP